MPYTLQSSSDDLVLSEATFACLRDLIYQASGLYFNKLNKRTFEHRLRSRVRALGFQSFERYYLHLRFDHRGEQELAHAIDALAVHETYFFREERALEAFRWEILPQLARMNARTCALHLWSAGCSTGEEAYTLAMLVREAGLFDDWRVKIVGSDISARAIRRAQVGIYERSSFRALKGERKERYFVRLEEGNWQIREELRRMVTFNVANLIEETAIEPERPFDVVFCRNVLLYFDERARRRAALRLHRALRDGGYLILGATESLAALDLPFKLVHLKNDLVYQKISGPVS
ncbi:MAG: chemotaxis protein CheR [Pyrinomonas sp.]|uniref:CheR family methyltransferase n=1 Tax=Pyrinomonas sp. TaxID=2080306 RepID=UPI0033204142